MAAARDLRYAPNFSDVQDEGPAMRIASMIASALAALCLLTAAAPATAQTRFEAAAKVNDQVVTRYDVEQRSRLLLLNGAPRDASLEARALDQLIEDRLKLEGARRAGIEPTDGAAEQALLEYARARGIDTVADLEQRLGRADIDPAALRDALVTDIVWRDAVRRRFGARAEPSEGELDQELALAAAGQARSYRLSEIVVTDRAGGSAAQARADAIARRLAGGGSFADIARSESAAPSAAQGGEIGWVGEGALPAPVAAALAATPDGGVTDPVPVPGGVAILRRHESRVEQAASVTVELVLVQAGGGDGLSRMRSFIDEGPTCDTAAELAASRGLELQRSEPMDMASLQPRTREAVAGLQEGEIAGPLQGGGAVAAFIMCRRIDGASPEARDGLRAQVRNQRLVGFAAGWLQELRGEAVIERR
jgi:peptidyl-prolyl cis-trans isomerase SurA